MTLAERSSRLRCLVLGWLAILAFAAGRQASAQTVEWIRQFGSSAGDSALAAAADSTGVYVAGETLGALSGQSSAGGKDAFLTKYDTAGNLLWTRQFGSSANDSALGVAADSSGVYVVGTTSGVLPGQTSAGGDDAFVRKYDASGTLLWTRQFGSSNIDSALQAAVDATGIYVAGITFGTLPGQTSAGQEDSFIRKYDANGNEIWTRQFGSAGSEDGTAVATDTSGIYLSGTTDGAFPGQIKGAFTDVFVQKFDSDGNALWTRQFSSTGSFAADSASAIGVDFSGVYVVGSTLGTLPGQTSSGGEDSFVRKYDFAGAELWTRQFGAQASSAFTEAFAGAAGGGGITIVGDTTGTLPGQTTSGNEDVYGRKYDIDGNLLWTAQYGSDGSDFGYGAVAGTNAVFVAGQTFATLSGQVSSGQQDAFLSRLTSPTEYHRRASPSRLAQGTEPCRWALRRDARGLQQQTQVSSALPQGRAAAARAQSTIPSPATLPLRPAAER